MAESDFSDETLMRYADGELDATAAASLERAMENDDGLAARVGMFIETRALSKDALKPLVEEPVPEELVRSVEAMIFASRQRRGEAMAPHASATGAGPGEAGNVAHFRARRLQRPRSAGWRLPLAASLAAALGGLGGYWLAGEAPRQPAGLQVAGIDSPALTEVLATAPSGAEVTLGGPQQRFRAIGTFRDAANDLCREFEIDSAARSTVISVACRRGETWQVSFAVVAPGNDTGYAPASSTEALDAYLSAIEAQPPMSAEEEARALSGLRP